jgi:transcriptional regulator with XRE-family HTH domain
MLLRRLIGSALRRSRLRQGRTLREVAHTARVSMPYLSEVERGRKEVSSEILAAICVALGLHLGDLLDEIRGELTLVPARPVPPVSPAPRSPAAPRPSVARPTAPRSSAPRPTAATRSTAATPPAAPGQAVASVAAPRCAPQAHTRRPSRTRHSARVRRIVRHVEVAPTLARELPGQRLAYLALASSPRPAFTVTVGARAGW